MLSGVSLRKSATICKVNVKTAFKWRHKIMDVLVKRLTYNKLKGTIEMDDTFFKQSFKGEKGKSNKTLPKLRGISHNLICYTTAVNRANLVVAKFNGYGKNSIEKMNNVFNGKIKVNSDTIVLTDEENAYIEWAKLNNIHLIQTNAEIVKRDNKLRNVNSLHSMLKSMIKRTHGVHSKYLDKYIQWVCWSKQISKLSFSSQINIMFEDLCRTYV